MPTARPLPPIRGQECHAPGCHYPATSIFRVEVASDYLMLLGLDSPARRLVDKGIMFFDRVYYVEDLIYACEGHYKHVWKPSQAERVDPIFRYYHYATPAFEEASLSVEELFREFRKLQKSD